MKKKTTLLLTLLLSFISTNMLLNNCNAFESNNKQQQVKHDNLAQLKTNKDWQAISSIWKDLNHFKGNNDYNKSRDKLTRLKNSVEKAKNNLNNLVNKKLLTADESNFIDAVLNQRLHHVERSVGLVTCYKPSPEGIKNMTTKSELEERYDTIEKLYKQNKINSETFKTTSQQIKKDLESLILFHISNK
ncbi:MAG: hypothetical protein AB1782_19020 [Cyanobacteriota bacterium]